MQFNPTITKTKPLYRLIGKGQWARLIRLSRLGNAQRLIVAGEENPLGAAHWIVTSASDASLAHEVTVLAGMALSVSCDCEGWQMSGCCKHVALVLKEARLGPWEIADEPARELEAELYWRHACMEQRWHNPGTEARS